MNSGKTRCCCIVSLRTGSIIILWTYLVCGIFLLSFPIIRSIARTDNSSETATSKPTSKYLEDKSFRIYKKTTTTPRIEVDIKHMSENLSLNYKAVKVFSTWAVPSGLMISVTSAIAIYGALKERATFMVPFLATSSFVMVSLAIIEIAICSQLEIICTVAYLTIHLEILFYLTYIVYSQYRVTAGYKQEV